MSKTPREDKLDPLIMPVVKLLNHNGFPTMASCDSGEGHAWPLPGVFVVVQRRTPNEIIDDMDVIAELLNLSGFIGFTIGYERVHQEPGKTATYVYYNIQFFDQDVLK